MTHLLLDSVDAAVSTLGPGPAVGIWVQGCGRACPECASEHTWSTSGGALADTDDVAAWIDASPHRHLTLSGGEPMDQAPALVELIDTIRRRRDWIVTCYSGFVLESLRRDVRPGTAALVDRLDLLIDGPYRAEHHAPLRWRGSTNQRLHRLTDRVEIPPDDVPAGITPVFGDDGSFRIVGVYPERGMFTRLIDGLTEGGTAVSVSVERRTFPFPTRVPVPTSKES